MSDRKTVTAVVTLTIEVANPASRSAGTALGVVLARQELVLEYDAGF